MIYEFKKYFTYFRNQFLNRDKLNYLILFITSKCNFKCKTCFFHNNLNKEDDLKLEEFYRISDKMGKFTILLLSGGEPFLNPHLVEICSRFIRNNHVEILVIPTNASLVDKIVKDTEILVKKFPNTIITISLSIDGLKEIHDRIRNIEDSFDKAVATLRQLYFFKKKYINMQVVVNSVIYKDNFESLKELSIYLRQYNLDYHALELFRGNFEANELDEISLVKAREIHKFILKNREYYINNRKNGLKKLIERIVVLGSLNYIHHLKELSIDNKSWPIKCRAGKSIAVIYPNGDVALCELRPAIGNMRNYDYGIYNILNSEKAQEELKRIKACSCKHICFINATVAAKLSTIFEVPYYYFTR